MKTETQLKAEIYNVVNPIIDLSWLSDPTLLKTFPCAVYTKIDTSGVYEFGIVRTAESSVFQIDLYFKPEEIVASDNLFDSVKTAMEGIDYRLIASPEFLNTDINKVIKATRWERYNV